MKRILLIEDDLELTELLCFYFKDEGFELDKENNGILGFEKAQNSHYDLLILDVSLPDKNGFDICRDLRISNNKVPILMLTARSEEIDRILGLELGADDYVVKPFSVRELLARVKALFRRMQFDEKEKQQENSFSFIDRGGLYIDIHKRKVTLDGQDINLTPTEYRLLVLLASNPGKNFSKEALLEKVWGYDFEGFKHTVSSHVNRLRSKVERNPHSPNFILTAWGYGYKFNENW